MSGPEHVPLIPMPGWLAGVEANLAGAPGGAGGDVAALQAIANGINPTASTINCGWNIDAAVARFTGADGGATSPANMDGNWQQIEVRHNTTFAWGSSIQGAFDAARNGGPGTAVIMGIGYSGGGAHVVAVVNMNGTVGVIEGQDWGNNNPREVITDPARANARYNSDGRSQIGVGVVGSGHP